MSTSAGGGNRDAQRDHRRDCKWPPKSARTDRGLIDARILRLPDILELELSISDVAGSSAGVLLQTALKQTANARRRGTGQCEPFRRMFENRGDGVGGVSRSNAACPVSISYNTQPKAQISVRLSIAFPRACSGLM